jgi:hypothetical protein
MSSGIPVLFAAGGSTISSRAVEKGDKRRQDQQKSALPNLRQGALAIGTAQWLDHSDVDRRRALLTLFNVEPHTIALVERPESLGFDPAVMNEDIRTILLFDKTVPLLVAEPLYDSLSHRDNLLISDKANGSNL